MLWSVDPLLGNYTKVMALETMAVASQWLSSDHVATPTDTNATMAQQQRIGVICAVRVEMLQAGRVSGPVRELAGWWVSESVRGLLGVSRCELLL
jgi:hypothetical protein